MHKYELELTDENIRSLLIDDKMNNQVYIEPLIKLLSTIDDNEIICIDGDWGSGKTILIKELNFLIDNCLENGVKNLKVLENIQKEIQDLKNNNLIFYYNAWENDDHEDAFESIIYNILNTFPKYKNIVSKNITKTDTVKEILNICTKIFTNKFLNIDFNSDIINKISTFDELAKKINTVEEKKSQFKALLEKILEDKRMILIVDELDRCNPEYASQLLEVLKHFYDLKNVTIIVVTNNNELVNIIKKHYGQNYDAYNYLNKFYDFIIRIDNSRNKKYCEKFLNFQSQTYLPHDVIYALIEKYNLTFRECNRFRTLYDMVKNDIEKEKQGWGILNKEEEYILYDIILPIILTFKIKDIDAYNECLNKGTKKIKEAIIYIQQNFETKNHGKWLNSFAKINKENPTDNEIADEIIKIYNKIISIQDYQDIFLNKITIGIIQ